MDGFKDINDINHYYVYIIYTTEGLYVGSTTNLDTRMRNHDIIQNHKVLHIVAKEFQCVDSIHLRAYEQLYCNRLKPQLNKQNAFTIYINGKKLQKLNINKDLTTFSYKCSKCSLDFPNKDELQIHKRECKIWCDICKEYFIYSYAIHINTREHQIKIGLLRENDLKCQICNKSFSCSKRYDNHIEKCKVHKCEKCDYKTNNKPNFERHLNKHK